MMNMAKKMNNAGGEAGMEMEETKCTCPECGYQGGMEEFESDKSMAENSPSGMKKGNLKNAIREAIGKAMSEEQEG